MSQTDCDPRPSLAALVLFAHGRRERSPKEAKELVALILGLLLAPSVGLKMQPKTGQCRLGIAGVVTERSQAKQPIEAWRCPRIRWIAPEPKAGLCEAPPRKKPAGVNLTAWCDVGMSKNILAGDLVALVEVGKKLKQSGDLGFRVGLRPIVVEFDADRYRIQIVDTSPACHSGVPGAQTFIDQLNNAPVLLDEVVGADLKAGICQRADRLAGRVVPGVVQDDEVGTAHPEVG